MFAGTKNIVTRARRQFASMSADAKHRHPRDQGTSISTPTYLGSRKILRLLTALARKAKGRQCWYTPGLGSEPTGQGRSGVDGGRAGKTVAIARRGNEGIHRGGARALAARRLLRAEAKIIHGNGGVCPACLYNTTTKSASISTTVTTTANKSFFDSRFVHDRSMGSALSWGLYYTVGTGGHGQQGTRHRTVRERRRL